MRAAGTELHDRAARGRAHDAVRLGGAQALVVEGDEQQRLEQLALNGRTLDGDDGLLREDGHALLNGPDVAVQLEILQVGEEFLVERLGGAQIVDVLAGKFQVIHGVDELLQTDHNGVAAAVYAAQRVLREASRTRPAIYIP